MKKIIFITCLMVSMLARGQGYQHFLPDSNAYISVSPYKFWFHGDTIINTKKFKKVYLQTYDSIPDLSQATFFAAVREDTLNARIYSLQKNDTIERIIADFSLKAGDTAHVYTYSWILNLNQPDPILKSSIIQNVDSILVSGSYRKRINIKETTNEWPYNESWIEGIGSTWGLFFPNAHINNSTIGLPRLLCLHIDNILVFDNNSITCYLNDFFVYTTNAEKTFPLIYPTFAYDRLYIKNIKVKNNNDLNYIIFDLYGRMIKQSILNTDYVDISDIRKGKYLILLYDSKMNCIIKNLFIKK
jgi:hypothetical protein